jgi:glycopeptide antibiotics resistance protein
LDQLVVLGGGPFIGIAAAVFIVWRIFCWRRDHTRLARQAVVVLLFAWSLVVAYLAFFPMHIILYDWHGTFSLVPFASSIDLIRHATPFTAVKNIAGNVLLFLPFGILLPLLFAKLQRVWPLAWRAAVLSAAIEIVQIPTQVRATDVDDVILNVVGALIGLLVFRAVWAMVKRSGRAVAVDERVGARVTREPLLAGLSPVVATLVLTVAILIPTVVSHTLTESGVTQTAAAGLPQGSVVARADVSGHLFVLARGSENGQELLQFTEYKRVLPGRFTHTTTGDIVRASGSGSAWSLTAYDVAHHEKPIVYVWGRNESGATSVVFSIRGQSPDHMFPIGRYFVAAFPYDDTADAADNGVIDRIDLRFVDDAGHDLTSQFAAW